jgi:glycine/D-amino acid oxidase-like deaminating enzyme
VVGGGFTGVATALTLAERGYKVAIVEANRIGWGASGRNGGQPPPVTGDDRPRPSPYDLVGRPSGRRP